MTNEIYEQLVAEIEAINEWDWYECAWLMGE